MMPRKKKVTLRELADDLGLTVHTVSKALRGLPGMSETTREDVFRRARALGYRTKAQEAGLSAERIPWVGGKPRRFAMLMSGDMPFHHQQLEGVQGRLNELGSIVHPLLVPSSLAGPEELAQWLDTCGVPYMDGMFLTATLPDWVETALLVLPLPKVLINFPPDSAAVDSVIWDVEHAIHLSMDMLYAHGHRSVLYVGQIGPPRGFELRLRAFQAAAARLGMEYARDTEGDGEREGADRVKWLDMLGDKLASGRFSAALSVIPGNAEWVRAAAAARQLAIPGRFSLIGLEHEENPHFTELSRPVLCIREAGERAAELMMRRIANPLLPCEHVRLRGPFLPGGTVAKPV